MGVGAARGRFPVLGNLHGKDPVESPRDRIAQRVIRVSLLQVQRHHQCIQRLKASISER